MIRRIGWPIISSALQPKIRAAPSFHEVTRPSSDLPTIASSDEETIAASRAAARSDGSVAGASSISSSTPATEPSGPRSRAGRGTKAARLPSGRSAKSTAASAGGWPAASVRAAGLAAGSSGAPSASSSRQAPLQRASPGAGLRPQSAAAAALWRITRPAASVAKAATGRLSIRSSSTVMVLAWVGARNAPLPTRNPARRFPRQCSACGTFGSILSGRLTRAMSGASPGSRGMAEREGFEPSRRFPAYTLSRRAPSTTRPPLRRPDKTTSRRPPQGSRRVPRIEPPADSR